jgi:Uncharacterized conserved protein
MKINKDDIKKRIIYRASYRGTKEMDVLISSFVNKIIHYLNENELLELEKFVNLSDEELIKLNKNFGENNTKNPNKIYKEFYNFKPI